MLPSGIGNVTITQASSCKMKSEARGACIKSEARRKEMKSEARRNKRSLKHAGVKSVQEMR